MNKKKILIPVIIAAAAGIVFFAVKNSGGKSRMMEISPRITSLKTVISINGVVQPRNRIQIRPPISGRIESVPVREGDKAAEGQVVAYLSSTDRAALIDMAKSQGPEEVKKWEELYKPIPITAPIAGDVIVRNVEPGQSVSPSDTVVVLSDRLIVNASADETDISRIKKGEKALVRLDAYPNREIPGTIAHISYESKTLNNVIVYEVFVETDMVPAFFRSGMSANIDIIKEEKKDILALSMNAFQRDEAGAYVMVKKNGSAEKRYIETGMVEDGMAEIVSGLDKDDKVMIEASKMGSGINRAGAGSPFAPARGAGRTRR